MSVTCAQQSDASTAFKDFEIACQFKPKVCAFAQFYCTVYEGEWGLKDLG